MRFPDPIASTGARESIPLSDGRVARVVEEHHASPKERWQMWKTMREAERDFARETGKRYRLRKRLLMNFMFVTTVLNPNCKACWYEIEDA